MVGVRGGREGPMACIHQRRRLDDHPAACGGRAAGRNPRPACAPVAAQARGPARGARRARRARFACTGNGRRSPRMAKALQDKTRPREQYGGARSGTGAAHLAGRRAVAACARPRRKGDGPGGARPACARSQPHPGRAGRDPRAFGVGHYADRIELDPKRLHEVEQRLEAAHNAARKFRTRPEALPELLASLRVRLKDLEMTTDLEGLARQEQAARSRYDGLATRLSAERNKAATKLGREVNAAMKELAMSGGRFEVELRSLLPHGSVAGNEQVEFLVTTNPGTEPRPLAKVASGGELSRISLAIQVITSRAAAVPTLIFDEVDAGIGGAVAEVVGRKLKTLGEERQVLCVTHLPQVAAQAREQGSVSKGIDGRGAPRRLAVLHHKSRIEEIARMLGGVAITATTRKHAAEMLGLR